MKTPRKVTPLEFIANMAKWQANALDVFKRCLKCQSEMDMAKVYLSLHAEELGECAGPGTVVELALPYCPNCEDRPAEQGCLHMPMDVVMRAALQETTALIGEL